MTPAFVATYTRPSGAKRTTVGLTSPLHTVVSVKPSGSVVANVGATGAPKGPAEAGETNTATSTAASRNARVTS